MDIQIDDKNIPGTVLMREAMGGVTGTEFLQKIFFITDGIMLSQIRDITGIDGTTLQNWTKRGWVETSRSKKYGSDQLARILIINMLRSCMRLDRIVFLISYINGRIYDRSDDIIGDSAVYGYICLILDRIRADAAAGSNLRQCIGEITADYRETVPGSAKRLCDVLEIIVIAYCASLIKQHSDSLTEKLING